MNFALLVHIAVGAPLDFLHAGRGLGNIVLLAICIYLLWLRWEWVKPDEEAKLSEPSLASMRTTEHLRQGRN
jgi:hypothetical protein